MSHGTEQERARLLADINRRVYGYASACAPLASIATGDIVFNTGAEIHFGHGAVTVVVAGKTFTLEQFAGYIAALEAAGENDTLEREV
jgi:hypothetical protein